MYCKTCGTALKTGMRFCKRCGTPQPEGAPFHSTAPTATAAMPAPIQADPSKYLDQSPSIYRSQKRLFIIVGIVIVTVLAVLIYRYVRGAPERHLQDAISQGNLLPPTAGNAYELYHQLKREDRDLTRFDEQLLPLLVSRPQKMLADFALPGSKEPSNTEWEEMRQRWDWASEIKPSDGTIGARAEYCAGRIAYLNNRKDEALQLWTRAGDRDKLWAMALNGVGLIYNERRDYTTARQFLYEAIRREPNWALPYNNLGTAYYYEKDYVQAESYYTKAVEKAPRWARPHAWLGDIAMRRNDPHRAVSEYQAVLDLAPAENSSLDLNQIRQRLEQAQQAARSVPQGD